MTDAIQNEQSFRFDGMCCWRYATRESEIYPHRLYREVRQYWREYTWV